MKKTLSDQHGHDNNSSKLNFCSLCDFKHKLQYFHTVTSGLNFPQYTDVGLVDGEPFVYYDSKIRKYIPKTEWIKQIIKEDPEYWNSGSQNQQAEEESYKQNEATIKQRFNHTTGVHTLQRMYGCEIEDDGTVRGYDQIGYDGEDFISLDLQTKTWTAAKPQAVMSKNKLDNTGTAAYDQFYLENICIEWLMKYVSIGRETLERKVPPDVSVYQKHSSLDVVCHATGFYPEEVKIFWQKNGEDLIEDVELGETLPNNDGSFQKRSLLKVPVKKLQRNNYTCVVQHSSLEKEILKPVINLKVEHKLQYFQTAVTPGLNFPQYTDVGLVDGEPFVYYDSNIRKYIPKTEWIKQIIDYDPEYWNRGTQNQQTEERTYIQNVAKIMQNFNHTKVHGCEMDEDDDKTVRGYDRLGYDGEDFISLDLQYVTWVVAKPQAVFFKHQLDMTGAAVYDKFYLENIFPPDVSVYQKHSSPDVVCHATGFYPEEVMITWQKDGEDLIEDVELGETLPNNDGSFQKRSLLKVPVEELQRNNYTCVVQHSSLEKEILKPVINLKGGRSDLLRVGVPAAAGGGVAALGASLGFLIWKKKSASNEDSNTTTNSKNNPDNGNGNTTNNHQQPQQPQQTQSSTPLTTTTPDNHNHQQPQHHQQPQSTLTTTTTNNNPNNHNQLQQPQLTPTTTTTNNHQQPQSTLTTTTTNNNPNNHNQLQQPQLTPTTTTTNNHQQPQSTLTTTTTNNNPNNHNQLQQPQTTPTTTTTNNHNQPQSTTPPATTNNGSTNNYTDNGHNMNNIQTSDCPLTENESRQHNQRSSLQSRIIRLKSRILTAGQEVMRDSISQSMIGVARSCP
ncbi:Class I histocompatibility antigen, Non-RT1.A alpha-1 chain [Bagarius yarrelli]|uniref:Class I histocompatibility antigen, Non-RT1.A alpha-1 chain n=1 Tax=Bagarius yarrelli TaxID=175774 RepID=A0A556VCU0_BAGYA|nr:Class I histocompatibility antigen, Non-RT1.A alpha-1 chain [Bagarius yarrelli]